MFTLTTPASSACLPWVLGMLVIGPQSSTNGSVSMVIGMDSILRAVKMLAGKGAVYFVRMWSHRFFFFFLSFFLSLLLLPSFLPLTYGLFFKKHFKICFFRSDLKGKQRMHSFVRSFHKYFWSTTMCARPCSRYWNTAGNKTNKNPCLQWAKSYGGKTKENRKSNKFYAWWW